jgi:hypothetical protein
LEAGVAGAASQFVEVAVGQTDGVGGSADWVAGYLIGLPYQFDIIEPDERRAEVVRQAEVILQRHRGDAAAAAHSGASA